MAEQKSKTNKTNKTNKTEKTEKAEEDTQEVDVPENLKDLVKQIEELKVSDLAKLVKVLEEKFGVSAQAPAAAAPAAQTQGEAQQEEKSEFDVVLNSVGSSKISVIKVVREATGKGLKDAKNLVDATQNEPQTIKESAKKEEAEELKKNIEEAGGEVELK